MAKQLSYEQLVERIRRLKEKDGRTLVEICAATKNQNGRPYSQAQLSRALNAKSKDGQEKDTNVLLAVAAELGERYERVVVYKLIKD